MENVLRLCHLDKNCKLVTTWWLLDDCYTRWLHDNCLMTAWWLVHSSLKILWQLRYVVVMNTRPQIRAFWADYSCMQFKKTTNCYKHTYVYGVAKLYHIYMHILHNALHSLSKCIHLLSMVIRVFKFSEGRVQHDAQFLKACHNTNFQNSTISFGCVHF